MRGATDPTDRRKIRAGDSAVAMDGMTARAFSAASINFCPAGRVARNGLHRRPAERSHVSRGLQLLAIRHGARSRHFGALNAVFNDLEERSIIRRPRQLWLRQRGSTVAFALSPVTSSAMYLKKFLSAGQVGVSARKLDLCFRFRCHGGRG